jgi:FixJ family two-component response regulator
LLVSDVVMPNLGGPQLAQQLAAERPSMQVLFVSGYAEATILRRGVVNLQTHFLQKPFSLRTLSAKIRGVLSQASAASAAS